MNLIRNYTPSEAMPLMKFITAFLNEIWDDHYGRLEIIKKDDGSYILELHTGGWSENEAIIEDILANPYLVNGPLVHIKWEIGGHYWFRFN